MTRGIKGFVMVVATAIMMLGMGTKAMAQCDCNDSGHYHGFKIESQKKKVYTEFGIGIGGVYNGIESISSTDILVKPRYGFQGHFDIAVCIGRNFAIETEVAYEGGSMDAIWKNLERRVKTRSVDIPLMLSLRFFDNRIRLSAGTLFAVMSNAEYTVDSNTYLFGAVMPTYNLAAGVGLRIGKHTLIEARYVYPLKETVNQFGAKEGETGLEFNMRGYKISAGITLLF